MCSAKRDRTNSPLQALILLNGEQYVEAARVLGERLQAETHGDVDQLISRATLACLSRLPDADERRILHQLYEEQRTHYQADADAAQALRAIGTTPPRKDVGSAEAAAAAVLVQRLRTACCVLLHEQTESLAESALPGSR